MSKPVREAETRGYERLRELAEAAIPAVSRGYGNPAEKAKRARDAMRRLERSLLAEENAADRMSA